MFGSNLVYCRRKARMSREELATRVGMDPAEIEKLELGAEWPDLAMILKLAAATNAPRPGLLLEGMGWVPGGDHPISASGGCFPMEYIPGHFGVAVGLEDEETTKARIRKRIKEDRPVLDRLAEEDGDPRLVTLGEALKTLRKEQGLTQARLAERAGVDVTYISHIERGERNPTLCVLSRICRGLEVGMPALFARIEELEGGSAP